MVLIAVLIALPVAWFGMDTWLSHYAFRTDLKGWFFILPVVLMFLNILCYCGLPDNEHYIEQAGKVIAI